MSKVNTNAKSLLAKLIATENIKVQHNNVPTAYFDVESRVLVLPKWENMNDDVYDMLVGHEVGHALFSPVGEQSILDALDQIVSSAPISVKKDYLNVVEDVRIEKKIQRKFPGFSRDFARGYRWMLDQDLFGILGKDVNSLPLIDRVNIHFKLRGMVMVDFTEEEMSVVREIENTESFDDVIAATNNLIAMVKNEGNNEDSEEGSVEIEENGNSDQGAGIPSPSQGNGGGQDNDSLAGVDIVEEAESNSDGNSDGNNGGESESDSDAETNSDNAADEDAIGDPVDSGNSDNSGSADGSDEDANGLNTGEVKNDTDRIESDDCSDIPMSTTQQNIESSLESMADYDSHREQTEYRDIPMPEEVTDMIYDYNEVRTICNRGKDWNRQVDWATPDFNSFMMDTKKVVSKMLQTFEMKKAAEESKRIETSKTGVLDTNKMVNYKWSEDIFLGNTVVNTGNNHGVVIFLDWSASMNDYMLDTIKQMITIAVFCKKASIPFEVYAFANNANLKKEWRGCSLLNLVSTKAKKADWVEMLLTAFTLGKVISGNYLHYRNLPNSLHTNSTPLNTCIAASKKVITDFRSNNGLDIVTPVFLTDGGASDSVFDTYRKVGINFSNGSSMEMTSHNQTQALLKWLSFETGCNICGISLVTSFKIKEIARDTECFDSKNGFCTFNENTKSQNRFCDDNISRLKSGYTQITYIGIDNKINKNFLDEVKVNATSKSIANAFDKDFKNSKITVSVMVSLVERISQHLF